MSMFRRLLISLFQRLVNREQQATAAPQLAGDKALQNPQLNALLAVLAVAYAISPIDAIPDLIPVVGWLDDGLVLWFGLNQAWKAMRGRYQQPTPAPVTVVETSATRVR
jgi:uncharacterized membrane protein YkvA (DUF1232 family)